MQVHILEYVFFAFILHKFFLFVVFSLFLLGFGRNCTSITHKNERSLGRCDRLSYNIKSIVMKMQPTMKDAVAGLKKPITG